MRKELAAILVSLFFLFSCESNPSKKNDVENYSDNSIQDTDLSNEHGDINDLEGYDDESEIDFENNDNSSEKTDEDTENYIKPPENLTAEDGISHNRILVTWDKLPTSPKVYIYRAEEEDGVYEKTGAWTTGNSFSDEKIIPEKTYYYKAKADYSLKKSDFSNIDSGYSLKENYSYEFDIVAGEEGDSFGKLKDPSGIKYDLVENTLVVADTGNDRIQFFDPGNLSCLNIAYKYFSPVYSGRVYPVTPGSNSVTITTGFNEEGTFFDSVYNNWDLDYNPKTVDIKMLYGFAGSSIMWRINGKEMSLIHAVDKGNSKIHIFNVSAHRFDNECYSDFCIDYYKSFGSKGSDDGKLNSPSGLTIHDNFDYWSFSNIYVVDSGNNRINVYNMYDGVFISSFGNSGENDGEFNNPADIAISKDGYIFITDSGNNRVQKFSLNGIFITKFGEKGNGDGQLNNPVGITIDGNGNVFVVDQGNNRIQKFKPGKNF